MSARRSLIVTGATGKQGGALISALVAQSTNPFRIFAVTRNPQSSGAQRLASKPGVTVIQGDFDTASAIFQQVEKPWGLFAMSDVRAGEKKEQAQGQMLVKAAVDAGVEHIVFTSTDRGGEEKSGTDPTNVPHFRSKYHIEQDLIAKSQASGGRLTYTILRPVAFFDNITPDFFGKGFTSMWRQNGEDTKLQFIATSDIGRVAAQAFLHAPEPEYKNVGISLAGDDISPREATRVFREVTGESIPESFGFVGTLLKLGVADLRLMFRWWLTDGFDVDVPVLKQRYPFLRDFRGWLREESPWKEQAKQ